MSADEKRVEENIIVEATGRDGEQIIEIIDVEVWVREKRPIPHGHKYRIRIDKEHYVVDVSHMTGEEILKLAGKTSAGYILTEKVGGQMRTVEPNQTVNFVEGKVERFATIPKEVQEGEGPVRADFQVLEEDAEHLNAKAYAWEAIAAPDGLQRIVVRGFEPPLGYTPTKVDMFVLIPRGYPDVQIDMVYFYPGLARSDGRTIRALIANNFEGKIWQGWSRHRTQNSPWRPGIDNLSTHLTLVDNFLRAELSK